MIHTLRNFPNVRTREVILRNVTTASGKALRISDNQFMFKNVKVTRSPGEQVGREKN
jgi:hypothetical protein